MENKKKSNAKTYIILIIIIAVSGFVGGFSTVYFDTLNKETIGMFFDNLGDYLVYIMPAVHFLINLITLIIPLVIYFREKSKFEKWDGEDESIEKIDATLSVAVSISTVSMGLTFLFGGINGYLVFYHIYDIDTFLFISLFFLGVYIWGIVNNIVLQKLIVDLAKKINPEKNGDYLSVKFNKQWLESCDEAEKLAIYKCGYKAYRIAVSSSIIMWVITFLGMINFDTGLFPVLCVSVILLIIVTTYTVESLRVNKKNKK